MFSPGSCVCSRFVAASGTVFLCETEPFSSAGSEAGRPVPAVPAVPFRHTCWQIDVSCRKGIDCRTLIWQQPFAKVSYLWLFQLLFEAG